MYKVEIEKRCLRELKKLDKPVIKKAIYIIENTLANNPFLGKLLKGKYKGLYSYRFSNYRIVYEVIEKKITVIVLRVGHRKDVYDGL